MHSLTYQQVLIEHQLHSRHITCKGKQKAGETIAVTQDFSDDGDRRGARSEGEVGASCEELGRADLQEEQLVRSLQSGSEPRVCGERKGEAAGSGGEGTGGVGTGVAEAGGPHRVRASVVGLRVRERGMECVRRRGVCEGGSRETEKGGCCYSWSRR